MVYHNPNPTSGAMKRSASALDGPPGWDVPPVSCLEQNGISVFYGIQSNI